MPDLTPFTRPSFIQDVYSHYERQNKDWRRPHLGASLMGTECRRFLWFSFRWTIAPSFSGRILRLFRTGDIEEGRIVADLRNAGINVFDKDPSEPNGQFHVTFSPHSGGSLDGIGCGFKESTKKWHVLEFKTHNDKSFLELQSKGVQKAKPLHYVQMQVYMAAMSKKFPGEFDRAMYIGVNKNTDEIYAERVKLDHMEAQRHIGKSLAVIDSASPSPRISDNEKNPDCLFCQYHGLCFGNEYREVEGKWQFVPFSRDKLERNCRTCLHSTPVPEINKEGVGAWTCAKDNSYIKDGKFKCEDHLFVPDLLYPWKVTGADRSGEFVEYDGGKNFKGGRIEEKG